MRVCPQCQLAVWPRADASSIVDLQDEQRVLLSEWGDKKLAFVLDGAHTKTSAAEQLRSEVHSGLTVTLLMCLGLSVFGTCWGGCGMGFLAGFFAGEGGDAVPSGCFVLWGLTVAVSVANICAALIGFFVRGSYVPLMCAWSVVACCFSGCIFAVRGGELGEQTKCRSESVDSDGSSEASD
eukprot:UN0632